MLSEQKFIEEIKNNQNIIFKVCNMYMDTKADRDDLFQEILFNAWKGIKNYKGESKFSTWLYSVAINTAITYFKREQRKPEMLNTNGIFLPSAEVIDIKDEQVTAMHKAINDLSKIDKALVILYIEEYSHQQIAEILGITANNVAVKINRIKIKLKEKSKKYL